MTTVRLNSGYDMPLVGLGTWMAGPGEVETAVRSAIEVGYRHIDCAYYYGNEAEIGSALTVTINQGVIARDELFIVSKLWNTRHHPDDVKPSLLESLDALGLKYLDLYLIHWPYAFKRGKDKDPTDADGNPIFDTIGYLETWKALEQCVDEGLVRSIGLSNFNSRQIQDVIDHSRIKPAVLQVEIHPYLQQEKLVEFCRQRNIVVTAYSSFGSPGWKATGISNDAKSILADDVIVSIGRRVGRSAAQVVLRWLVQRQVVVIPKSTSAARLRENLQVFDFSLSAEDMELMRKLDKNLRMNVFVVERNGKMEMRDKNAPNFPFNLEF